MKKKIKDLTLAELLKYCRNKNCKNCKFNTNYGKDYYVKCEIEIVAEHSDDYFEQEIEIEDVEVNKG